jgi:VanZ family protein
MGLIFMLSSQSDLPAPYEFPESDKVFHVLAYVPLGFLMVYALSRSTSSANLIFFGAFLAFLYGVTDEIHQYFVPGRDASALDVMADGAGAMIGSFIYTKLRFGKDIRGRTSEVT